MKNINTLDVEGVKDLNQFALYTATFAVSLASLIRLNMHAIKSGLLSEDQIELAQVIIWEAQRTAKGMNSLIDAINEIAPIDIEKELNKLISSKGNK